VKTLIRGAEVESKSDADVIMFWLLRARLVSCNETSSNMDWRPAPCYRARTGITEDEGCGNRI
jgi:hypothetical protein